MTPETSMRVLAVGASAGGVQALTALAGVLPADLAIPVVVVLHIPSGSASALASIMDRAGPLRAVTAEDDQLLKPGVIHVAVPDRHLLVDGDRLVLADGPTENSHRPAINALFRSVALSAGPAAVGLLLSGVLDDGVAGLIAIKAHGGVTIAQNPDDAMFPAMPRNAIAAGAVDHVLPAAKMADLVVHIARQPWDKDRVMEPDARLELENRIAIGSRFATRYNPDDLGPPSGYTCPDCNGSLLETGYGGFRCRVGHAWTVESLLRARDGEVQQALWVALRSLDEKAKLSHTMAQHATGSPALRHRYLSAENEAATAAEVLRTHLLAAFDVHSDSSEI